MKFMKTTLLILRALYKEIGKYPNLKAKLYDFFIIR